MDPERDLTQDIRDYMNLIDEVVEATMARRRRWDTDAKLRQFLSDQGDIDRFNRAGITLVWLPGWRDRS